MNLLITGGTGFFGRALLRHLSRNSDTSTPSFGVTVLSRSASRLTEQHPEFLSLPWLRFKDADITDPGTMITHEKFTHVIHAATDSTHRSSMTLMDQYDQIVQGTRNVLELAVNCQAERFLFVSSGAVYGKQPTGMDAIPEDHLGMPDPLIAENVYGVAKRSAEHICALMSKMHPIQVVIARCFAFSGEDLPLDAHFAIGNFVRDAVFQEEILVHGDGSPFRSYMDQADLANWLMNLLERGESLRAYNVGSDQAIAIDELAHRVRNLLCPEKTVRILGNRTINNSRNRYIPDIKRAREELGVSLQVSLDQSILAMGAAAQKRGISS